ncbi:MAG: hypothetical protein ACREJB_00585 [Planctomycetaceae bacterium]
MLRKRLRFGVVQQAFYTPDGRHLVTVNGNGTVYVLRLAEWPVSDTAAEN